MHKQEYDGCSDWVEGNRSVLPFLETPGTKVQITMTMHVGDSCLQVLRLTGSYT